MATKGSATLNFGTGVKDTSVDWMALSADLKAAERLFEIWKREQIRKEDDDIIMLYVSEYM